MIDLHIHSSLSDGACSVEEILDLANKANLSCISITDHNHALAYEEPSKFNGFMGHILPGCEIATSYNGFIIEILGLGINPSVINAWYRNFYSEENLKKNEIYLFNKLKNLCIKENLKLDTNITMDKIKKGYCKRLIYENLIKYMENMEQNELKSFHDFFRHGLSNPENPLFLNEAETYPQLLEVVNLIHKAKGRAFLAHPFEYGFSNVLETAEEILKLAPLDGIECFHPSASIYESNKLTDLCRAHFLYISGGSDFHSFKRNTRVGLSSGNQPVKDEMILPWVSKNMLLK